MSDDMIMITKAPVSDDRRERANDLIRDIYQSEYRNMFHYAYNILDDKNLAETAVQETFVVALRKYAQFLDSDSPAGWVYNALKYTIKHMCRERQYLLLHNISMSEAEVQVKMKQDRYDLESDETDASPNMDLLIEHYLQGFSIKEIAAKHGLSVGACKMRMNRARATLAKKFEK